MADLRAASVPVDRDHVEARMLKLGVAERDVVHRDPRDLTLLAAIDHFRSVTVIGVPAAANFDEAQHPAIACDDVDFPTTATVVAREDHEALLLEVPARQVLAPAAPRGCDPALYLPRRQRVPSGVSSSTMPSVSSLARAASAFWNSRFLRAA